jgi:energy-coupling factor transporter ATP-binding protein EcfA2
MSNPSHHALKGAPFPHAATLTDLQVAHLLEFLDLAPEDETFEEEPPAQATYLDAEVRSPFNSEDYQRPIIVSLGAKTDSKQWKPITGPLYKFLGNLCEHKVGQKDGPAFVLGDMHPGQRLKAAVKSMYAIGLDIDVGTPASVVKAALDKLGCLAVCYSTHSHGKVETEFKRDKVRKFNSDADIDTELMRDFVLTDQNWDRGTAETVEFVREEHTDKGIVVVIAHDPMAKWRLVFPIDTPFVIAEEGNTQKDATDKWAKVIDSMAAKLGLPYDRACIDPSRWFYFPRHDKKRPFEIMIWGGPLFDWHTLELEVLSAKESSKRRSKSVTPEGRELGRWAIKRAAGFQIVDVIEAYAPEKIRGTASQGVIIECPFDEDHSDAGNTNDKACLAINAGMGHSPIFTIMCHHESCRDKTAIDHVGKMVKEGWIPREALDAPQFQAEVIDPTGEAETGDAKSNSNKEVAGPTGRYFESMQEALAALRKEVAILLDGGKCAYIIEKDNGRFEIVSADAAHLWYSNWYYPVETSDGTEWKKAFPAYVSSVNRLAFVGLTPDPRAPQRSGLLYSTWRGYAVQPRAGSWELLRSHLLNVVCGGNQSTFNYIMGWLAQLLQQPEKKLGTAVVLRGPKGCGKTTIGEALRRIIGPRHSIKVSQQKHITGNFNDHQRDVIFILIEEGVWGGNKLAEGVLKDLITGYTLTVEAKFRGVTEVDNFTRLMIVSNEDWVVPAGPGERRFLVLDVEDPFPGLDEDAPERAAYFDAIYREMDNGGLEAMLEELLRWDFSNINLRKPPVTQGLSKQISQSLTPGQQWLFDVLTTGEFTDYDGAILHRWEIDEVCEIPTEALVKSYRAHVIPYNKGAMPMTRLLDLLKEHGNPTKKRLKGYGRPYGYVLGTRREWQQAFEKAYHQKFDNQAYEAAAEDDESQGD